MAARELLTAMKAGEGAASAGESASVFVVAGEASGDWAGARLAEELRRRRPELRLRGIGGRQMTAAGVELFADSSDWGAIGVFEAASKVARVWRVLGATRAHLRVERPSALVLIDCGSFNMPLAESAQKMGIPTLYYLPPGSWSRKPRSLRVREVVDAIATPFPWSRDLLAGGKARVEWVGHPVVEAARPKIGAEEAARRYGVNRGRAVVALAPGSRSQEMRYLFPVLAEAAARLGREFDGLQFLAPVAPTVNPEEVREGLEGAGVKAVLLAGMDYDALQLAQAAAVCSGTATLEFACLGVPMVVAYRASRLTTLQYRLIRGLIGGQRFAAMPNIIAGREIVRELMGSAASPAAIAARVGRLLVDDPERARVTRELELVAAALGPPGASERTAELVLGLIEGGEEPGEARG